MPLLRCLGLALVVLLLSPGPAAAADWSWPMDGPSPQVSRPFGLGPTPYSPGHRGADLAGTAGQAVLAAGSGQVTYAGLLAGRGVVTVTHGALRTTYEPVAASVRVGQQVAAGEPLGTLSPGHEGCPAPACLHWGLRRGEAYLDPVRLLRPGPVRLLPPPAALPAAVETPDLRPGAPVRAPVPAKATRASAEAPRTSLAVGLTAAGGIVLAGTSLRRLAGRASGPGP